MHLTLHLTTGCNMSCGYCYARPAGREDMPPDVLDAAVDLAARVSAGNVGLVFFGGEPLLRKDLIARAVARARRIEEERGPIFHFKLTTNGLLLDDDFLDWATRSRVHCALSLDGPGPTHDRHRRTRDDGGTFDRIATRAAALLARQPYAPALMTVTPETVGAYAGSVELLLSLGFRYVIASLDYSGQWQDGHLAVLAGQYRTLADLYERLTRAGEKFYFSPFEKKLASHIHGAEAVCRRCHFGVRQLSVAPDGTLYPCVQFVGDGRRNRAWAIGEVSSGIDAGRQADLCAASRRMSAACAGCAIEQRCEHLCSCLNWQTTGAIDVVSPVLCATERLLVPIVDVLGERLYARRVPLFVQKHYNVAYPLISCLEDLA